MQLLQPEEYNISYFDGGKTSLSHNASYSRYRRWERINNDFLPHAESTGEYWKDFAKRLFQDYNLSGKKVLEIGCAKGYVIEDLRDLGVNAFGLDVSSYAIGEAIKKVKPYLIVADARTYLKNYSVNEFDFIFSRWTLECFSETDLIEIIAQMNRISKLQVHIIDKDILPQYYTRKPIDWWLSLNFSKGTIIFPHNKMIKEYKK